MKQRRFVQDDDCHWYLIPAELYNKFRPWEEYMCDEEGTIEYDGPDFGQYEIGSPEFFLFNEDSYQEIK